MGILHTRNFLKTALLSGLFIGLVVVTNAQTVTEEEVTVIAPYSPRIAKAKKIFSFPESEENINTKFKLEYYTNPKLISTTFELEELKAARYRSPKDPKYKQNLVKGGLGLYTTPYAEVFLNKNWSKKLTFGLHAKHLSSKATVKDFAFSGFSKNAAEIWSKITGGKNVLWLSGFYERNSFHYYGFDPDDYFINFTKPPNFDELSAQTFSNLGLKFSLYSTSNRKKESYRLNGSYRYFWDQYSNKENLINLNGNYQRPIEFIGLDNQRIGVGFDTEIAMSVWEEYSQDVPKELERIALYNPQEIFHGKFDLQLFYTIQFDRFNFKAGGVLSAGMDTTSTVKVYPDFLLSASIIENALDMYVQFDGGLISPSYYSLSQENPFVSAFVPFEYSSRTYRLKGGFTANIAGAADIHLWASMESIENAQFFTTDTSGIYDNQFSLIYDDVELQQFGGDLRCTLGKVDLSGQLIYQEYKMTNERSAWYKPSWQWQLNGEYWVYDNFRVNMALNGQSKVMAKIGGFRRAIGAWTDLSLGANYNFNKDFSAFLNFNNILSENYHLWYNYPVKGMGVMAGISYAF